MSEEPRQLRDAYGHVALPRFLSGEEFLRVMDQNGVAEALVCTAETCPDLVELSRTAVRWPGRFRVAGLPTGASPQERLESVRAQLAAGFFGIRIHESLIVKEPALLDAMGREGAVPVVVGSDGLGVAAPNLLEFLERYPDSLVLAPHFASGGTPEMFHRMPGIDRLFRHPRFGVIFSRHGMFRRSELLDWARSLLDRTGWDRAMWGSEYPVALYRDESYASTALWIDGTGLSPTEEERTAYLSGNAQRLIFSRPAPPAKPLDERWCRRDLKSNAPVWLFPAGTIDLPEEVNRRLVEAFLSLGGDRTGSYRDFVARTIAEAATRLEP